MYERLLNKDKRPTHDELASYCGKNAELFTSLHTFLSGELDTISEIRFHMEKSMVGVFVIVRVRNSFVIFLQKMVHLLLWFAALHSNMRVFMIMFRII